MKKYKYLFLDRDGVINTERPGDYVKNISEFVFIDGALDAIRILSAEFEYIFIITNQRGIGREIMDISDLQEIHNFMLEEIEKNKGEITNIYFCTDIDSISINRKPNIGMAFQAQKDYPTVDFHQSIMVGNSKSDIEFGKKLGMYTVLVGDKYLKDHKIYKDIDAHYENLHKFAESFEQ